MQGKVEICGVNTANLKVLKSEETRALLEKAQSGDAAARDELIRGNLRLVLSVIQKFAGRGENVDDLFQVGCIGLIKAIDNFDFENHDVKFSTYGVPMMFLRGNSMATSSVRQNTYTKIGCPTITKRYGAVRQPSLLPRHLSGSFYIHITSQRRNLMPHMKRKLTLLLVCLLLLGGTAGASSEEVEADASAEIIEEAGLSEVIYIPDSPALLADFGTDSAVRYNYTFWGGEAKWNALSSGVFPEVVNIVVAEDNIVDLY